MMSNKNYLIVEGDSDKIFFESLTNKLNLYVEVTVATPKDIEIEAYTTKQGVFNTLNTLLKQLDDGSVERLGIVIDADFNLNNSGKTGFENTLIQVSNILSKKGFDLKTHTSSGIFFESPEFENQIGLWVMPNNNDEGYLEGWIESSLTDIEKQHYNEITSFTNSVVQRFKPHNLTKANIYTWLALNEKPTQDICACLFRNLISEERSSYEELISFFQNTFG